VKYLDLEKALKEKEAFYEDELLRQSMKVSQIDTREFAAINELFQAREQLKADSEHIEELTGQIKLLTEENKILHEQLSEDSQKSYKYAMKAKLDEVNKMNNILKCSCELYEEEMKKLKDSNLELEERILEMQKEINKGLIKKEKGKKVKKITPVQSSVEIYEEKITQLINDLERKDRHIINLVNLIGCKDNMPQVIGKIVALLHRASQLNKPDINY
jgi:uncharacterized coiled-coil DUF342 family protein